MYIYICIYTALSSVVPRRVACSIMQSLSTEAAQRHGVLCAVYYWQMYDRRGGRRMPCLAAIAWRCGAEHVQKHIYIHIHIHIKT